MILARHSLYPVLGLFLVTGILSTASAADETGEDVQTLNSEALASMEADHWEEALKLLTHCIELHGQDALARFGPQFGVTWYRKGICELRLKRWEAAAKSFETCYRGFPNPGEQGRDGGNLFQKRALLRWGEAAQGAGNHEEAIRMFKKFLEERDKTRDTFDPGSYYINLSICHSKLNQIPEGTEHLETAIKNKARFQTPDSGIVAAFQALVTAVIENRDEAALLSFIGRNRAEIVAEPFEMAVYAPFFLKLAGDAIGAGMDAGAIALCQLVPSTDVMIEDLKSRISRLGNLAGMKESANMPRIKDLEASLEKLDKQRREGDPNEVVQLGMIAFIHEKQGNVRGAFAAYEQLELFFPKSKKRADNLFHLVRTGSVLGEVAATGTYGSGFLKDYPDSKHAPAVRRMMLTTPFQQGDHEACIIVATAMLPTLSEGTVEHDICLHVLGGSYYYTGRQDKAQPLLDLHVEKYPKSRFEEASLYFQASNLSRLRRWPEAAGRLDTFLEKHPDPAKNLYYPFALLDRAYCHSARNEHAEALGKLDRLEKGFPGTEVLDKANLLKGNLLLGEGKREEAETCYKKALDLAGRRGNRVLAGEALYLLVALLGERTIGKLDNPRIREALPYVDRFWKEHGNDSPFKARVAVSQVHALMAAGRHGEALDRLREVINGAAAAHADDPELEQAIHSYAGVYLVKHGIDELMDHCRSFPGISGRNQPALALLRMEVIDASEDALAKAGSDPVKRDQAEARIKLMFQELKNDFEVKALPGQVLVRTGDHLREKTSAPRQALPYYDEVLSRPDPPYRFAALFGRAAVLAQGSKEERAEAVEILKRVFTDSRDKTERELALFGILQAQIAAGDHQAAEATARQYLSGEAGEAYTRFAPDVGFALARCCHERGQTDEALANYLRVWSTHRDLLRISAPALKAWMELSWQRNSPGGESDKSDRQRAYESGWTYIDQTRRHLDQASDEEKKWWVQIEALVSEYEAAPEVKSMAKLKEEAAGKP